MLTLEQFEKALKTLQEFQDLMHKIDELTHNENVGFNDFYFALTNQYVKLIEAHFKHADDEWIDYWLYEKIKGKLYAGHKGKAYDIADVKDLYYWLCEDYDKVKRWEE